MASRTEIPLASRRFRSSSSSLPTSARLPMNGVPKRTPSSSEKPTTSTANGSRRASRDSRRATAITTPRTPSKAPALGTVSRCEPRSSLGAEGCAAAYKAAQIAGRVDSHFGPRGYEPLGDFAVTIMHRRREKRAPRAASIFRERRQLLCSEQSLLPRDFLRSQLWTQNSNPAAEGAPRYSRVAHRSAQKSRWDCPAQSVKGRRADSVCWASPIRCRRFPEH